MKKLILTLLCIPLFSLAQENTENQRIFNPDRTVIEAQASCGICMFDMQGKECALAVQVNDSTYYVKGAGIDDYGDAHAKEGFCNAIRDVIIQGEVVDATFQLTYFQLKANKALKN